jgi:hypothetical protein
MIKNIFLGAILMNVMHMHAMQKECSLVPHFPRDVWTKIAQYMVGLHYELMKSVSKEQLCHAPFSFRKNIKTAYLQ